MLRDHTLVHADPAELVARAREITRSLRCGCPRVALSYSAEAVVSREPRVQPDRLVLPHQRRQLVLHRLRQPAAELLRLLRWVDLLRDHPVDDAEV